MEYFKSPDITLEGELDEYQSLFIVTILEVAETEKLSFDEVLRITDILNGNTTIKEGELSQREMNLLRKCTRALAKNGMIH